MDEAEAVLRQKAGSRKPDFFFRFTHKEPVEQDQVDSDDYRPKAISEDFRQAE